MDEHAKDESEKKTSIFDFTKMEEMINHVIAIDPSLRQFGLRKEHYWVHLSSDIDSLWKIQPGHVVKIWLKWPDGYADLHKAMHDAFRTIIRHNLRRSMEVVPYMVTQLERKKWIKEHFTDESDIIFDLIPRTRLRITHKLITTLTDVQTGESISTEMDTVDEMKLRVDLSRIVRSKYKYLKLVDDTSIEDDEKKDE